MKRKHCGDTTPPVLPVELLMLVAHQLEPVQALLLSGTCSALHDAFRPVRVALRDLLGLKLWHVKRPRHIPGDYDTYSDFVCCCASEAQARACHPSNEPPPRVPGVSVFQLLQVGVQHGSIYPFSGWVSRADGRGNRYRSWVFFEEREELIVTRLGLADAHQKADIICASFHAG